MASYYSLMATYHTIIAAKKEYFFLMTTKQYVMWPAVFVIHIFGLRWEVYKEDKKSHKKEPQTQSPCMHV